MTDNEARTVLGLTGKLAASLPGQFLALLFLNLIVVGGLLWIEDRRSEGREHVLIKLLETCGQGERHGMAQGGVERG